MHAKRDEKNTNREEERSTWVSSLKGSIMRSSRKSYGNALVHSLKNKCVNKGFFYCPQNRIGCWQLRELRRRVSSWRPDQTKKKEEMQARVHMGSNDRLSETLLSLFRSSFLFHSFSTKGGGGGFSQYNLLLFHLTSFILKTHESCFANLATTDWEATGVMTVFPRFHVIRWGGGGWGDGMIN